jgi:hypothetical protein
MIKIEVIESQDLNLLGSVTFQKNLITLGDLKDDFPLHDELLFSQHLIIEVEENIINCFLNPDVDFFHVNGKRTKVYKSLHVNDVIQIGNTKFKILEANFSHIPTLNEILNKKMDELIKSKPDIVEIIKELKEMAKDGKHL